jgi:hypothetical protein
MEEEKPGCIIDLHSNTGFSKGPAKQYAEYFPFVDKLWFGESFQYNEMSYGNWLVEVSGIPFGLMGDMLHGGGNSWLGMVFGWCHPQGPGHQRFPGSTTIRREGQDHRPAAQGIFIIPGGTIV